jgi:hypothetical protein
MDFIESVKFGKLGRLRLRWGNGFPVELDYVGLVGGSPGRASVGSESSVALKVISTPSADLAVGETELNRRIACVVAPLSALVGDTLATVDLRERQGVIALALHRRGEDFRDHLVKQNRTATNFRRSDGAGSP